MCELDHANLIRPGRALPQPLLREHPCPPSSPQHTSEPSSRTPADRPGTAVPQDCWLGCLGWAHPKATNEYQTSESKKKKILKNTEHAKKLGTPTHIIST